MVVKETPNPNALMFLPGRDVLGPNSGTMSFTDQQSALTSPLALALFDHVPAVTNVRFRSTRSGLCLRLCCFRLVEMVKRTKNGRLGVNDGGGGGGMAYREILGRTQVFLAADFISVTISGGSDDSWSTARPLVVQCIQDFYEEGKPILLAEATANRFSAPDTAVLATDDETVAEIKELLNTIIRPTVQDDGGDIAYHGFVDGEVLLELQGACSGCPSSSVTVRETRSSSTHPLPCIQCTGFSQNDCVCSSRRTWSEC